ncbi:MAG: TIGR03905 family TSCPD domain-containing protein [Clostridia bacterium]
MEVFSTKGTCARQIVFEVENNVLTDLRFIGGCSGNLQGISRLVKGMKLDDIIAKVENIQCRNGTSCPDQLAKALKEYKAKQIK